jgi:hypothetical protein
MMNTPIRVKTMKEKASVFLAEGYCHGLAFSMFSQKRKWPPQGEAWSPQKKKLGHLTSNPIIL